MLLVTVRSIVAPITVMAGALVVTLMFAHDSVPQAVYSKKTDTQGSLGPLKFHQSGSFKCILSHSRHSCAGRTYVASDGAKLSMSYAHFSSRGDARRALNDELKKAMEIIERGAKVTKKGQRVGDRVLVVLPSSGSSEHVYSLYWTDTKWLYFVNAPSLRHVLEFEKSYVSDPP